MIVKIRTIDDDIKQKGGGCSTLLAFDCLVLYETAATTVCGKLDHKTDCALDVLSLSFRVEGG